MLRLLFLVVAAAAIQCGDGKPPQADVHSVMSDIHDGDMKCLTVKAGTDTLTITPYKTPKHTWVVEFVFNFTSCQGLVDFRVPGKPNPPPVPLMFSSASLEAGDHAAFSSGTSPWTQPFPFPWFASPTGAPTQRVAVFSDPSGTIADPSVLFNFWVLNMTSDQPIPGCGSWDPQIIAAHSADAAGTAPAALS